MIFVISIQYSHFTTQDFVDSWVDQRVKLPEVPAEEDLPHAFQAGWKGQDTCELLFEGLGIRVGTCAFPHGIGHEKHYHNPHFGYVLEGGTLSIRDAAGERTVTTKTNGAWSTTERTVHEAVNTGDTTTSYVIVEPRGQ